MAKVELPRASRVSMALLPGSPMGDVCSNFQTPNWIEYAYSVKKRSLVFVGIPDAQRLIISIADILIV